MDLSLLLISAVFTSFSFIPKLKSKHWAARGFDFIKLQLTAIQLVWLVVILIYPTTLFTSVLSLLLILVALYSNLKRIVKYTRLTKTTVDSSPLLNQKKYKLLTINILQTNKKKQLFIENINKLRPDIILLLEVDKLWHDTLLALQVEYPYIISKPQSNLYGISMLSKYPIDRAKIKHIVKSSIPSIDCIINLDGQDVRFFGIHPEPPSPTEQETSRDRDAELMRLATQIKNINSTTIVSGDLNDVIWSLTSEVFTKESGLSDPRIGRGFFATFSAKLPLIFRFPVDQLYHTKDIHCHHLSTHKVDGSDHLGVLYSFTLHPHKKTKEPKQKLDEEEKELLETSKIL